MRSSRDALFAIALTFVLALAACGTDERRECTQPALSYARIGEPYFASWCRGCHGVDVPPPMRQRAPVGMDFDTVDEIRASLPSIQDTIEVGSMPPAGGPNDNDRALVLQWLSCGAP